MLIYPDRCHQCYMRIDVCVCPLIPILKNKTPVSVIMHSRETYKTTNTARIACLALKNSRIFIHGKKDDPADFSQIHYDTHQSVLLTLNERSQFLNEDFINQFNKPLHLIVPDGNWRQANKMGHRITQLNAIPWIKLSPGPLSGYFLRHEHHPEGLSTLEAMARALKIIEGPHIEHALLKLFNVMVQRTLKTRPYNRQEMNLKSIQPKV